jgi:hypothetical protein
MKFIKYLVFEPNPVFWFIFGIFLGQVILYLMRH